MLVFLEVLYPAMTAYLQKETMFTRYLAPGAREGAEREWIKNSSFISCITDFKNYFAVEVLFCCQRYHHAGLFLSDEATVLS